MRSMEDLKGRYYTIARQLLVAREGGAEQVANHTLVKHPFNAETEKCVPHTLLGLERMTMQEVSKNASWN